MVTVWGKDVSFTPKAICEFYDTPYYETDFLESTYLINFDDIDMDSIIKYLTENRGEWKYRSDIGLPTNFNQAIMFPIAKMWMQFICTSITPTLNVSNVNTFRAILLYEILQKKQIRIGKWIHQSMKRCVSGQKESGLIIQVFARENNIKVSNYLPKIIDPDHSIANPTIREVKMRKEAKMKRRRPQSKTFKREDDDYDETFQSQYFTPRGPVIRIPTQHAHSSGGGSSRGHISGKGKAPMVRGQSHHFDNSNN
ncbi:hypothetical protein Goarm_012792 [Gossypium armourianum]|uniref:Putative plant transposon protein domain-containing protein n=1 Tax=Gossypium armourianum TaxID=34283 RepID=A0A7J9J227_9ROSI|nr:hypothetical protein [Gossypium armourianum]